MEFSDTSFEQMPLAAKQRIDAVCQRFERAWRGVRPSIEEFVGEVPLDEQAVLIGELLHIELESRRRLGEIPSPADYLDRLPHWRAVIHCVFRSTGQGEITMDAPGMTSPALQALEVQPEAPGYEILAELGRGGMGVVYKARHRVLNRLVALKFILAGPNAPERHRERFRHEAELVAKLRHPHITQIYDIGEAGGRVYLALEYAEAGTLRDRLDGNPLEPRLAVMLMEPLARAVQHAHRNNIVHRDIKPGNILLILGGESLSASARQPVDWQPPTDLPPGADPLPPLHFCVPKLTDFGLARLLRAEPPAGEPSLAAGTPSYMAPEQVMGDEPGPLVDVWALGATLYELLTGHPPFQASTSAETFQQVLMLNPRPPSKIRSEVPKALDDITMKCLEKDPANRYVGARELAQDLRAFLTNPPIVEPEGIVGWAKRRPALALGIAGAVLVVLGSAAGILGAMLYARLQ